MTAVVPKEISCPECGSKDINGDPEGRCCCVNDHVFWDTNAPEWLMLRGQIPIDFSELSGPIRLFAESLFNGWTSRDGYPDKFKDRSYAT